MPDTKPTVETVRVGLFIDCPNVYNEIKRTCGESHVLDYTRLNVLIKRLMVPRRRPDVIQRVRIVRHAFTSPELDNSNPQFVKFLKHQGYEVHERSKSLIGYLLNDTSLQEIFIVGSDNDYGPLFDYDTRLRLISLSPSKALIAKTTTYIDIQEAGLVIDASNIPTS